MVWHQVNAVFFLPSLLLFCSFPCGRIGSSVIEISVISVVIAHSLAPSATLALKHTLCVSGHGGCALSPSLSFSISLTPSFSLFPFVPVKCYLLFPNKADWRKLWCKAPILPSRCREHGRFWVSVSVFEAMPLSSVINACLCHLSLMYVCVWTVYYLQFVRQFCDTKELCQVPQYESGCRAAECLTVAVKTNTSSPLWKNLTLWKWQLWQWWESIHVEFPNCVAFGRLGKCQRGKITWIYL